MTNQDSIVQLTALKGQHENDATAIGVALKILTTGYESDEQDVREQIDSGVAAGLAEAVAPLNKQIADLEAQLALKQDVAEDASATVD